jgi:hypothetical protein
MKKRLIITEKQLENLKLRLNETTSNSLIVKEMKTFLDSNYEPSENFVREGGEYFDKPMVKIKIDDELITVKALYEYMRYKFENINPEFTKQVIRDWMFNKISDDYMLSKPINH